MHAGDVTYSGDAEAEDTIDVPVMAQDDNAVCLLLYKIIICLLWHKLTICLLKNNYSPIVVEPTKVQINPPIQMEPVVAQNQGDLLFCAITGIWSSCA